MGFPPSVIGVVLARGGSKRIPSKNSRIMAGKPLVVWTIEAALASRSLSRLIVSTDDAQIAELARRAGAEVPFIRPSELAGDSVPSIDVVLHAAAWLSQMENATADYIMCLHPTSPLRSAQDIDGAIELAVAKDADSVIGVSEASVTTHPLRALRRNADGTVESWYDNDMQHAAGQDLPEAFCPNGAIMLARTSFLQAHRSWIGKSTYPYIMPAERSVDVDTELDFCLTEFLFGYLNANGKTRQVEDAPERSLCGSPLKKSDGSFRSSAFLGGMAHAKREGD